MGLKNKEFIVAGIKNLLTTNYKIPADKYDIETEVDSKLSFSENWKNFKEKFKIHSLKEQIDSLKEQIDRMRHIK